MLMFIGSPSSIRERVYSGADGTIAAATSTERLSLIAGKYVGRTTGRFDRPCAAELSGGWGRCWIRSVIPGSSRLDARLA